MSISVLTLTKNRDAHLAQQVEGLRRSETPPDEHVIVNMGAAPVAVASVPWKVKMIALPSAHLPLAAARNAAASVATSQTLLFLDVDCIPARGLVGAVARAMAGFDGLLCAEVRYLAADEARGAWDEADLRTRAARHPHRPFPESGLRAEPNAGLFWSLAFAVRRARFAAIGGFDERFTGYGAEDTEFAFRARDAGVVLAFIGGPGAFHQHHAVYDPPLQHFDDIIANARRFYELRGQWPMRGWLDAFAALGLIALSADRIEILREPSGAEQAGAYRAGARF
jgi:GT2 family glycosyltransferase